MKIALSRAHLPAVLWGSACIGLALVIGGMELDWGSQLHAPLPIPHKPVDTPVQSRLLPEFILPPLEQGYSETINRPLFVVNRRAAPKPAAPKPAMQKGQFVLLGVIIVKDSSIALLKEKGSGKTYRVAKGKQINGITLEKVEAEKVTLIQSDDSEELTLKIQPMVKLPQAPDPVPALAPTSSPARSAQEPGQAGQPIANTAPASAAAAPAAMAGAKNPNDMVNRRRALRGLPPI